MTAVHTLTFLIYCSQLAAASCRKANGNKLQSLQERIQQLDVQLRKQQVILVVVMFQNCVSAEVNHFCYTTWKKAVYTHFIKYIQSDIRAERLIAKIILQSSFSRSNDKHVCCSAAIGRNATSSWTQSSSLTNESCDTKMKSSLMIQYLSESSQHHFLTWEQVLTVSDDSCSKSLFSFSSFIQQGVCVQQETDNNSERRRRRRRRRRRSLLKLTLSGHNPTLTLVHTHSHTHMQIWMPTAIRLSSGLLLFMVNLSQAPPPHLPPPPHLLSSSLWQQPRS